ncbi:MAG: hypothetical protein ACUVWJ_08490, partial [Spirochaetota bacterium]
MSNKRIRNTFLFFNLLLFIFLSSISSILGGDISGNTTFTLDDSSVAAETGFTLTFDTSTDGGTRDRVRIDFSNFGTTSTDFNLNGVSTNLSDYSFTNFDTNPDTVSVDNTNKWITFTGCSISAGKSGVQIVYNDNPGSHYIRNDIDASTNNIVISIGAFVDWAVKSTTISAKQADSVTAQITSPAVR